MPIINTFCINFYSCSSSLHFFICFICAVATKTGHSWLWNLFISVIYEVYRSYLMLIWLFHLFSSLQSPYFIFICHIHSLSFGIFFLATLFIFNNFFRCSLRAHISWEVIPVMKSMLYSLIMLPLWLTLNPLSDFIAK